MGWPEQPEKREVEKLRGSGKQQPQKAEHQKAATLSGWYCGIRIAECGMKTREVDKLRR
jgi:hypothetical protein